MTRRCALNLMGFAATALILLGVMLGFGGRPSKADTHSYASQRRQVKACVLVSNAASKTVVIGGQNVIIPENDVPYVFYMMDSRNDFKPAGWEFMNPLAPATISPDMVQRWQNRDTGNTDASLSGPLFKVGGPLTKNIGAYWEVNLDTVSQDDLDQFDVVLLAYTHNQTQFSPNEREKLRKYADAGGTVWLEDEGGFDIQNLALLNPHNNGQFFIPVKFTAALNGAPTLASSHHPLVNFPYSIANTEVGSLGIGGVGVHHGALDPVAGPVAPNML
ncbi:MAG TPA: hypothetical protein VKU00_24090, partial [Chthonomonadaceae bacterium]|nr:hypothetical protein [Chthonomonadaceae bacterium]